MAEQKWALTAMIGAIVLLSAGAYVFYNSDYKYLIASMPDKEIFILKYDSGDKVEIVTRSSVCEYALFRITKDGLTAKCGYRVVMDARYFLEYLKTYGEDEWVRLDRKASKISLDVSETEGGFLVRKTTPYYATKSRTGSAGDLIETYKVTKDSVKSSLEFRTAYTSRDWRVVWNTKPNVQILDDQPDYVRLDRNLNVFFSDALFDRRVDDNAYYKPQPGSFRIDPLLQFGNQSGTLTTGSFSYGFCSECVNLNNVSFSESSSAFSAVYESGWAFGRNLREVSNLTMECTDPIGAGYCELTIRNGTDIMPANDSSTITRCLFNNSLSCQDSRAAVGSGQTFNASAFQDYSGIRIDGADTIYLAINDTGELNSSGATAPNLTINMSKGYLEMMVTFK